MIVRSASTRTASVLSVAGSANVVFPGVPGVTLSVAVRIPSLPTPLIVRATLTWGPVCSGALQYLLALDTDWQVKMRCSWDD